VTSSRRLWACDTSVAVASLDPQHEAHVPCRRALVELRPALAGHAVFETYSVLTRLPPPLRLTPQQAAQVLRAAFAEDCWLDAEQSSQLRAELGSLGLVGGSMYDALVGRAAMVNDRVLLTRDRRAERTYRAIGADYEVVG
jgi:predicted nucleic acid-binding protein